MTGSPENSPYPGDGSRPNPTPPGYPAGSGFAPGGQYGSAPQGYPPGTQPGPAAPGYPPPPGYPAPNAQVGSYPPGAHGASSYGPGSGPGPTRPDRPGMVTAAVVLAFVFGGFAIIASVGVLLASSVINYASSLCSSTQLNDPGYQANCAAISGTTSGFLKVVSVGLIIVAILLIWGGVWAITGKNQQLLVIGTGVYFVLAIASMIAGGSAGSNIFGIALAVLILVFLFNPASRAWFRARGGKTF